MEIRYVLVLLIIVLMISNVILCALNRKKTSISLILITLVLYLISNWHILFIIYVYLTNLDKVI